MFLQILIAIVVLFVTYNLFIDIWDMVNKEALTNFIQVDKQVDSDGSKYFTIDPSKIRDGDLINADTMTSDEVGKDCSNNKIGCLGYIEYNDAGDMYKKTKRHEYTNMILNVSKDNICIKEGGQMHKVNSGKK